MTPSEARLRKLYARGEAKQALQVAKAFADARAKLRPFITALEQQLTLAAKVKETSGARGPRGPRGLTGREVIELSSFAALMLQTQEVFGEFGKTLYELTLEGVKQGVSEGLSEAEELLLEPVRPHHLEKARGLLSFPTPDEILAGLGAGGAVP